MDGNQAGENAKGSVHIDHTPSNFELVINKFRPTATEFVKHKTNIASHVLGNALSGKSIV